MRPYERLYSHAYTALNCAKAGFYKNETILHAYDVSGYVDEERTRFKERILIITTVRVLYV